MDYISKIGSVTSGVSAERNLEIRDRSSIGATSPTQESDEKSFGNLLKDLVRDTQETQAQADGATRELIAGRNKDIHGAMIAMEKADVSLRMLMQVRNKVIDAYREIMRMQV